MFKYLFTILFVLFNSFNLNAQLFDPFSLPENQDVKALYGNFIKAFPLGYTFKRDTMSLVSSPIDIDWEALIYREAGTIKNGKKRINAPEIAECLIGKRKEKIACESMRISPYYGFNIFAPANINVGYMTVRLFPKSFYIERIIIDQKHTGKKYSFHALQLLEEALIHRSNLLPETCETLELQTTTHSPLASYATKLGYIQVGKYGNYINPPHPLQAKVAIALRLIKYIR